MRATTAARYRETGEERFRQLLGAWLATLPFDGWTGGVAELFEALDSFESAGKFQADRKLGLPSKIVHPGFDTPMQNALVFSICTKSGLNAERPQEQLPISLGKFYAFVPSSSGLTKKLLSHDDTIRAAGFALRIGRTKSARFVTFAPSNG